MASRDAGRRGSLGLCGARFEWRRLLAELGGTFFLVLVAAGADVVNAVGGGQVGRAAAVTAPGIMVLALIYDTVLRTAGDNPVPAGLAAAADPAGRVHQPRTALPDPQEHDPAEGYGEMATGGPSRFPADVRCQTSQGSGSLSP